MSDVQARRGPELYGFARRLGMSAEAADDAVQETLLRLWAALVRGADVESPDAWAFTTLYRLVMDQHRWRRRGRLLLERIRPRTSDEPQAAVSARIALWDAVDRLPERQRAVIYLRYRADLPHEEIADILGIAPASVRSHASRALDHLGRALTREDFR